MIGDYISLQLSIRIIFDTNQGSRKVVVLPFSFFFSIPVLSQNHQLAIRMIPLHGPITLSSPVGSFFFQRPIRIVPFIGPIFISVVNANRTNYRIDGLGSIFYSKV
ncbi:MAG: hypothetical protein CMN77_12430 [Spirochaetaceae bacterium]|nr:hypothetical protein [Spirochaetaceae bacterium]